MKFRAIHHFLKNFFNRRIWIETLSIHILCKPDINTWKSFATNFSFTFQYTGFKNGCQGEERMGSGHPFSTDSSRIFTMYQPAHGSCHEWNDPSRMEFYQYDPILILEVWLRIACQNIYFGFKCMVLSWLLLICLTGCGFNTIDLTFLSS